MFKLQFKQRGRAEINYLTAISTGSTAVRLEAKNDIKQIVDHISIDNLPDDLDQRNELLEHELKDSKAFRIQQLIGEWHSQNHGPIAINAFEQIEPELRQELQALESGPATLERDQNFMPPDYWKGVEFHRTIGTWEGHEYMGLIHGEIIHREMVAKFFPGGIFKQRLEVAASAPKDQYARILDLGCSSGHFTQALAETYPESEITGIDLSIRMLEHSQRLANKQGWAWKLYQRAAENTGFDDDSFDLVTSYILLHELPADIVQAVFNEAFRVAKPGGDLLMSDVTRYSNMNKHEQWLADRGAMYGGEPHWRASASLDLKQVAESAGFVDVQAGGMHGKPYPYLVSGRKPL